MADDRLIVAMDVPHAVAGLELAQQLGDSVSFYKIGLGMLTGGGLALANELKQDRDDLDACLIRNGEVSDLVQDRASRAFAAGADGVIASPQEAAAIRALPEAHDRLIVTPGVRPAGADMGDQKRVATPANAIADGADHIVVGRPIWRADQPREAAQAILSELSSPQAHGPTR